MFNNGARRALAGTWETAPEPPAPWATRGPTFREEKPKPGAPAPPPPGPGVGQLGRTSSPPPRPGAAPGSRPVPADPAGEHRPRPLPRAVPAETKSPGAGRTLGQGRLGWGCRSQPVGKSWQLWGSPGSAFSEPRGPRGKKWGCLTSLRVGEAGGSRDREPTQAAVANIILNIRGYAGGGESSHPGPPLGAGPAPPGFLGGGAVSPLIVFLSLLSVSPSLSLCLCLITLYLLVSVSHCPISSSTLLPDQPSSH